MYGFISYSHCDSKQVHRLRNHLQPVMRRLHVSLWMDEEIHAGDRWDRKIRDALDRARPFIFCISCDLLSSPYINETERTTAREKHERGEALVVPVIIRECVWEYEPVFAELQAVPTGGCPIQSWSPRDRGYAHAARRIGVMLQHHLAGNTP